MVVNAFLPSFVGPVPLYGVHYYGGILLMSFWAMTLAPPFRRPAFFAVAGAVLGGYALTRWNLGSNQGLFAGAVGAALFLVPLSREGWCWRTLGDRAIAPLALAFGLMKLGCLAGGCCLGGPHDGALVAKYHLHWPVAPLVLRETPQWEGIGLFPAPLYVALGSLGIALLALGAARRFRPRPGSLMVFGVGIYCLGRAGIDWMAGTPASLLNAALGLTLAVLLVGVWLSETVSRSTESGRLSSPLEGLRGAFPFLEPSRR